MVAPKRPKHPHVVDFATSIEPSTQQLRFFLVLSEELHFGYAATRLFVTKSALSQQMRTLEKRLGVRLFERTSRSVALTSAGRSLLPEARAAVEAIDRLRRAAEVQQRQLAGRLTVGTIGAEASMPQTRAVLGELRRQQPHVEIQILSLTIADHLAALYRQEVDIAFLRPPVSDDIELLHLATEPRVACISSSDPLAAHQRITIAQLNGYPVVNFPPETPREWWSFWAVDPRPDGTPVRYGPIAADIEALLHAISQGEGMSFLPAVARDFFSRPGLTYVDVDGIPPCTSALAWVAERRYDPLVAAAQRAAQSVIRNRTDS
ncbi:LysR family transcriptional regulator [Streptomyces dioscori]|uniref:LysR family transcriptional regulator n=1 Tax=Streptomyces dioscori TaxID=2109333 RepID=A0A2P8Q0Y7_9ACTN|nr:LysR family transcriptional regulator [Streptomyces dioscori]PSM39900.1 LysR family transcriptional regulator [Streptomyces dioscori]